MTTLADRLQHAIDDIIQEFLTLHIANSTMRVGSFQLVKVLEFRPEISKVLICRESIEISKHSISLYMSRVIEVDMRRIGVHTLYLCPHSIGVIAQIDAVTQALTHLLFAVSSRQTTCRCVLRQHDIRLYQHLTIHLIEAADKFACEFNHRLLVFACRDSGGLESCNIGGL